MKLPWYVISKPTFGKYIPIIGKYTAYSIGPLIFVPTDIYEDLKTKNPKPQHLALLLHEQTHRQKQQQTGYLKFAFLYLFNPRFRFNEELAAVKEGMRYLKKAQIEFNFDRKAKFLSSYLYLWPVSKSYAAKELKRVWDEV